MIKKYLRQFLLLFTLFSLSSLFLLSSFSLAYQGTDSSEPFFQNGHFEQAVQSLKATLIKLTPGSEAYVDTSVHLAIAYQSLGHFKSALQILRTAESMLEEINDPVRHAIILSHLSDIHLALSLVSNDNTCSILLSDKRTASQSDKKTALDTALDCINRALEKAEQSHDSLLMANTLNRQGNLFIVQQQYDKALQAYREGLQLAEKKNDNVLMAKIWLNVTQTIVQHNDPQKIDEEDVERLFGKSTFQLFTMTFEQVNLLPSSYDKAFALIGLAKAMRDFKEKEKAKQKSSCKTISPSSTKMDSSRAALPPLPPEIIPKIFPTEPKLKLDGAQKNELSQLSFDALTQAIKIAQKIQNVRAISYAKGYLAQLYEEQQRYSEAIQLTRQAIFSAQQNRDYPELLYRWEGQLGRLFEKQGDSQKAIDAYEWAIFCIKQGKIRQELQAGYRIYQTSREVMSPIYLGLADLLLKRAEQENGEEQQKSFKAARNHLESFKDLELRDYFQDECVIKLNEKREAYEDNKLSKNTALLYPVLLEDRIELLLSLRTGIRQFIVSESNNYALEEQAMQFRHALQYQKESVRIFAQKFYQWLIQPIANTLINHQIKNLVIVPDGILRTIPFTALHDGEQYLVESYAITIMPKLQIPNQMPLHEIKVLLGGFSKEPQHPDFQERGYGFSALENVAIELEGLKAMLNVPATNRLQNDDFTFSQLQKKVKTEEFNIIHFATHGHFGNEPNETFLVAHDGKMTMNELRNLVSPTKFRETPIELLTLSACQTAVGDEQAALGLAGIALSSGARSALASLWKVSDPSTAELMKYFYQNLLNNQSKAYALQNAQRQLLQHPNYQHPYYWAAFLLIEN